MTRVALIALTACFSVGCVPDPGPAPYTSGEDFDAKGAADVAFLEGPSPYQQGELRLSVGLAYEGGAIETHAIDGVTSHSYIYILDQCDETSALTYTPGTSTDRVEGKRSDLVTQGALGWWGHGVHWDQPKDMRTWGMMHLSLKALSGHDALEVHMGSSAPGGGVDPCDPASSPTGEAGVEVLASVDATAYGYVADGEWHTLSIPLSDFTGLDLNAVNIAFSLTSEGGAQGDQLLFDNLYFTP
ncbi:MAG: hypothetical protein ACPGU1_21405 [Myxococcota bacterium]